MAACFLSSCVSSRTTRLVSTAVITAFDFARDSAS
jgi:hypothetical protein